MKRLTVFAAALAAGSMTSAAYAQEAPVNSAQQFMAAPATDEPAAAKAPVAQASKPMIAAAHLDGRGGLGISAAAATATQSETADAVAETGIDQTATASIEKPSERDDDSQAEVEIAAKQKTGKAAVETAAKTEAPAEEKAAKASKKPKADKPEVELVFEAPIPGQRPELVATARKASVLTGSEKSASTDGDKELIAGAKKTAEKKAAALGTGGKYQEIVTKYASAYGVPVSLAHAVITIESNYRASATGRAGEIGLMQIKPATARMMGYSGSTKGLYNPETNIKYGMKYLGKARELGGGTTCGTILRYNAGHGAKRMNPISAAYCSKVKRHLGSA